MTEHGERVEHEIMISLDIETAFNRFTDEINLWWPKNHSRSGVESSVVTLERHIDGCMFETTEDGERFNFGRVVALDEPNLIALDWFMGSGPDNPSRVSIHFEAIDTGTRVSVVHEGVEVIGELWWKRVAIFERAWSDVLARFAG